MKLWITQTFLEAYGQTCPRFYGVAYTDHCRGRVLFAWYPLNFILRWAYHLYCRLMLHRNNDNWLQLRMNRIRQEGYYEGFADGETQGIRLTKEMVEYWYKPNPSEAAEEQAGSSGASSDIPAS